MSNVIQKIQVADFVPMLVASVLAWTIGSRIGGQNFARTSVGRFVACSTFLAYASLAFLQLRSVDATVAILVRALMVSALAVGAVSLLMPMIAVLAYGLRFVERWVSKWSAARERKKNAADKRRRAAEDLLRRHEADQQYQSAEIERAAKRAAEELSNQRRKEVRSRCELLFYLRKTDIAKRFTRKMFDDYMTKFMADSEQPDVVERRGQELRAMIEQHQEQAKGPQQPSSIEQLATWYLDQKMRIDGLGLEEDMKDEHLAHLEIRYAELSQEILEKMRP